MTSNVIYNRDNYDIKVAKIISNIHSTQSNSNRLKWLNENKEHLENMYIISGLECGINIFSDYIYYNSI